MSRRTLLAAAVWSVVLAIGPRVAAARPAPDGAQTHVSPSQTAARAVPSPTGGPSSPDVSRAPGGAPLAGAGVQIGAQVGEEGEKAPLTAGAEADPLVSNGLGSPLCRRGPGAGVLGPADRSHCETSGFVAAAAPNGNYGLDVHIDTGLLGLSRGGLLALIQDLVIQPVWMALVLFVHTLIVVLEWSFRLDLVNGGALDAVGGGLRRMQSAITQPWLALAFAVASVQLVYSGIVRRRAADALGQAILALAMTAGGMWVILDPADTVGALGTWANEASLGALAVAATGKPSAPDAALAASMSGVFVATVEAPWCYLEFGDLDWCRNPSRLDSRLYAAGTGIAADEERAAGCQTGRGVSVPCTSGSAGNALVRSAQLLRGARTNGALFLALPPNGPARNSINRAGSLLHTLCQSYDATGCRGPTAAQAQFRTDGGTWPRLLGLLLIAAGVSGMLMLLGFVGLRLIAAALLSLVLLLLGPAAVLAPAFGESGRMLFRRWATGLFGAVISKLVFSFVLGVVLAVEGFLADLTALGWLTQWLLISAFWWILFARRHQALGLIHCAVGREPAAHIPWTARIDRAVGPQRRAASAYKRRKERRDVDAARADQLNEALRGKLEGEEYARRMAMAMGAGAGSRFAARRGRSTGPGGDRPPPGQTPPGGPPVDPRPMGGPSGGGGTPGAEDHRSEVASQERGARVAHGDTIDPSVLAAGGAAAGPRPRAERAARRLDEQVGRPSAAAAARTGTEGRDYAALAELAGMRAGDYEQMGPERQAAVRAQIDRDLALRRAVMSKADRPSKEGVDARDAKRIASSPPVPASPSTSAPRPASGGSPEEPSPVAAPPRRSRSPQESPVMLDLIEVAEGRKRQLGIGKP